MNIIGKYSIFSRWFYLIVLGLTIPYYLLLYGASGHKFNPPPEDIIWMTVVVIAFACFKSVLLNAPSVSSSFNVAELNSGISSHELD